MAVTFNPNEILFKSEVSNFLKLGENAATTNLTLEDFQTSRYNKIEEIWGTLGWANDRPLDLDGAITFSRIGGDSHKGVTKQVTELLKAQNVEINALEEISERFIDLNSLNFRSVPNKVSSLSEIQLRLELFLDKAEGALVYIQNNPIGELHSDNAIIRLITPNKTDANHSQNRFSLTYIFEHTFGKIPEYKNDRLVLEEINTDFLPVLKILTFKRKESDIGVYMKKVSKNLGNLPVDLAHRGLHKLGEKKYALLKFNSEIVTDLKGGQFEVVPEDREVKTYIDSSKRTLLLLHGTFSTTDGSFDELTDFRLTHGAKSVSLLQKFLLVGKYEQVIAFDHPTASHSPKDNINELLQRLSGVVFAEELDVITTSRGALLADVICSSDVAHRVMKLNKVLMFAPAHGSDLLNAAKGFDHLLSYFQLTAATTAWGFILGLAQFSVEAIRTQPGLEAMRPGSDILNEILKSEPISEVRFKAMVGDFHRKAIDKKYVRPFAVMLDGIVKMIFRGENDWVIGCHEQRVKIHGNKAIYEKNYEYYCIHGMQFRADHPLNENFENAEVFDVIETYFLDSNNHIA